MFVEKKSILTKFNYKMITLEEYQKMFDEKENELRIITESKCEKKDKIIENLLQLTPQTFDELTKSDTFLLELVKQGNRILSYEIRECLIDVKYVDCIGKVYSKTYRRV